jgi:hypothetical protein
MSSFEEEVQKASDTREIPGVVLLTSDAKGIFSHHFSIVLVPN